MKKTLFLAFCASALLSACSKSDNSNPGTTTNTGGNNTTSQPDSSMQYIVNGLTDITINPTDSTYLALGVNLEKGTQEKVTLSVTGLPQNVSAGFSAPSGIPSFGTIITIKSQKATPGSYPIKFTGTTASGKVKSYDLNLKVNEQPVKPGYECIKDIVGKYQMTSNCINMTYAIEMSMNDDGTGIVLKNFPEQGVEIDMTVRCDLRMAQSTNITSGDYYFGIASISFSDMNNITAYFSYSSSKVNNGQPQNCGYNIKK